MLDYTLISIFVNFLYENIHILFGTGNFYLYKSKTMAPILTT